MPFHPPKWYKRQVTVPLYRLSKRIYPLVWVIALFVGLVAIPAALYLKLTVRDNDRVFLVEFIEHPTEWRYLLVAVIVFSWGAMFMFFVNGAFVLIRKLAGLPVRNQGSLLSWALWKYRRSRRLDRPN